MWLLAAAAAVAAATSLHWLKHTARDLQQSSSGELDLNECSKPLIFRFNSFASATECDTSPGPETHVEYIDICGYIFQITACFSCILVYFHFCYFFFVAVWQRRYRGGSVTTLTRCTCQTSAVTLYFSAWLFTHLSTADISDETIPFVRRSHHINSVSYMLPAACLDGAERGLLNCNAAPRWLNLGTTHLARCSFAGGLCHLKNSKHPVNVAQTDVKCLWSLLNNRWSPMTGYNWAVFMTWALCRKDDSFLESKCLCLRIEVRFYCISLSISRGWVCKLKRNFVFI